jgi:hypothetical protein
MYPQYNNLKEREREREREKNKKKKKEKRNALLHKIQKSVPWAQNCCLRFHFVGNGEEGLSSAETVSC